VVYRFDIVLDVTPTHCHGPDEVEELTPSQTAGPLLGMGLAFEGSDVAAGDEKDSIKLTGRVSSMIDEAVLTLVEIWQGDEFVRAYAGEGTYTCIIRKPEPVIGTDGIAQAPFLHFQIFDALLSDHYRTRLYFPDEVEANAIDRVLQIVEPERRSTLIAKESGDGLRFDIRLAGEGEQVFFD
jgi:protocatechuate 3,4-dioxygenase alpha subunit